MPLTQVADETGNIVESYRFEAWGRVLGVYDQFNNPLAQSAIGNRYLWQGREYSWKSGLYYFRTRWYDPIAGRWLSNDPIGINGGLNQYQAFLSNPVNFRDPNGLDVYMIQEGYTTYWAVDNGSGGVEMFHYSGQSWNTGSSQWRVFGSDQAEISRYTDPSTFLKEYYPNMPPTADSIRKLADNNFWSQRFKTTCDEDKQILQKFRDAYNNQDNLRYNALGVWNPNCDSFGGRIVSSVIGTFRWMTGLGPILH